MAYTYTDLTIKLKIDPLWLADSATVFVSVQPQNGETVEVETSDIDTTSGVISATLTQTESAKLFGWCRVQANGFLNGERWATEVKRIYIEQNTIRRVIADE